MQNPLSVEPDDFCFIDTETRSHVSVVEAGAYQHMAHGRVIICTYAIGDGDVQEWVLENWSPDQRLDWSKAPEDLADFLVRVKAGEAWFVAWNAAFDRVALSRGMRGEPMQVEWFIDAMAQAVKSHLPPDLMGACYAARVKVKKQANGKALIKLFCDEANAATPQSHLEEWADFRSYAHDDIPSMREIYWGTLPLSRKEWEEYWANERINDVGMPVDVAFVRKASELAEHSASLANQQIVALTDGRISTVNQSAAILDLIRDNLRAHSAVNRILTREIVEEPTEDGEDVVTREKYSLDRGRVEEVIHFLERLRDERGLTDEEQTALRILEVRLYGASATPRKFTKMLPMFDEGRIKGQYVFNGASATGRYSSRGVQMHNLSRATIGSRDDELDAIETITDKGAEAYSQLETRFGPVGRTLSRLIRPAFCAPEGRTFVWCDWSAIEARVLPWLAGTRTAEDVLGVFRANDADPSLPDIYKVEAGKLLGKDPKDVTKAERQSHGKVPVLSLGFAGGKGALFNMARIYGASFTDDEAEAAVRGWRDANPWAKRFWGEVWDAANYSIENPGQVYAAGRIQYIYEAGYMGGTLFAVMPCGRALLYPRIRWENVETKDKSTGKSVEKLQMTYKRGRGRAGLWVGILVENVTQAFAGSLLRNALWRLDKEMPGFVVGHTHDEIVGLCDMKDVERAKHRLESIMGGTPEWAEGLPLAAESVVSEYYTKTAE